LHTTSEHTVGVHPVSTVFFLLGYALALPAAFRMRDIVAQQHRLALAGHQAGLTLASVGWLLRGSVSIAVIHLAWAIGVRVWFALGARRPAPR
jgi:hypothetical protein